MSTAQGACQARSAATWSHSGVSACSGTDESEVRGSVIIFDTTNGSSAMHWSTHAFVPSDERHMDTGSALTTVADRTLGKVAVAALHAVRSSSMTYWAQPTRSRRPMSQRWLRGLWQTHRLLVAAGVVVVALAVILGLLWPLTDVIAAHDVGLIAGPRRGPALQSAREAVRTQLGLRAGRLDFAGKSLYDR